MGDSPERSGSLPSSVTLHSTPATDHSVPWSTPASKLHQHVAKKHVVNCSTPPPGQHGMHDAHVMDVCWSPVTSWTNKGPTSARTWTSTEPYTDELSEYASRLSVLEQRVQELEKRLARYEDRCAPVDDALLMPASELPPGPGLDGLRPETPDAFNPFQRFESEVKLENTAQPSLHPEPPGAQDFPQRLLVFPQPTAATPASKRPVVPSTSDNASWPFALGKSAHAPRNDAETRPEKHGIDATTVTDPELSVERILLGNSHEASIQLQHQLKHAPECRREAILQALVPRILELSLDRHGNFLVQRALSMRPSLAWNLKGGFVYLSLSPFGSHVVQRVLEDAWALRAAVVHELLHEQLLVTLTSRCSIHVWQKIFVMEWDNDEIPQQISREVQNVLRGHWIDVATKEIGSILFQNLLESHIIPEDGEGVQEILRNFESCAGNQWGVWIVQHLLEHCGEKVKKPTLQKLLQHAGSVSLSAYGSKAVLSALRIGDADFQNAYVQLICGEQDDPDKAPAKSVAKPLIIDLGTQAHGLHIITHVRTPFSAASVDARSYSQPRLPKTAPRSSMSCGKIPCTSKATRRASAYSSCVVGAYIFTAQR